MKEGSSQDELRLLLYRAEILCYKRIQDRPVTDKNECRRHAYAINKIVQTKDDSFKGQIEALINESDQPDTIKNIMRSDWDGIMNRNQSVKETKRSPIQNLFDSGLKSPTFITSKALRPVNHDDSSTKTTKRSSIQRIFDSGLKSPSFVTSKSLRDKDLSDLISKAIPPSNAKPIQRKVPSPSPVLETDPALDDPRPQEVLGSNKSKSKSSKVLRSISKESASDTSNTVAPVFTAASFDEVSSLRELRKMATMKDYSEHFATLVSEETTIEDKVKIMQNIHATLGETPKLNLMPQQAEVAKYVNLYLPKPFLQFHVMGSGKTVTALSSAVIWCLRRKDPVAAAKRVFVSAPHTLAQAAKNNFYTDLTEKWQYVCPHVTSEKGLAQLDDSEKKFNDTVREVFETLKKRFQKSRGGVISHKDFKETLKASNISLGGGSTSCSHSRSP